MNIFVTIIVFIIIIAVVVVHFERVAGRGIPRAVHVTGLVSLALLGFAVITSSPNSQGSSTKSSEVTKTTGCESFASSSWSLGYFFSNRGCGAHIQGGRGTAGLRDVRSARSTGRRTLISTSGSVRPRGTALRGLIVLN